ncbi:hypothetical protein ZEAMMB73_Zm00001d021011 [Zea mays]|uniref:Uncharacterized protein n=1 Tax=Zea mays TaxID=4577 RepID=A0A1D6I7V3_MAIZE|nr:hypothetical protein ZEAMMB73_Zm00001d021011 [Zea mays]
MDRLFLWLHEGLAACLVACDQDGNSHGGYWVFRAYPSSVLNQTPIFKTVPSEVDVTCSSAGARRHHRFLP